MSYHPRPRRHIEDLAGTAIAMLAVLSLIVWEGYGFYLWSVNYGVVPAALATLTAVGNFAIPFLTGDWFYLWWGFGNFAAFLIGSAIAGPR